MWENEKLSFTQENEKRSRTKKKESGGKNEVRDTNADWLGRGGGNIFHTD